MPLLVGIDEAGYGPVLGPFICAATIWQTTDESAPGDTWELLSDAVCRPGGGRHESRLPVGDSKKVFDRHSGLHTLERTVLAFASAAGLQTNTLSTLLTSLGAKLRGDIETCPWYRDLDRPIPTDPARCAYEGASARLRQSMERAAFRLIGVRTIVVTEDRFNHRVLATRNKSAVVIESVLTHIDDAARRAADQPLIVRADRLGGRSNYRDVLMGAFPARRLTELVAADHESRYRLDGAPAPWDIAFLVQAEERHLPVALASMFAKYVRELLMGAFNHYWQQVVPGLRPTAGYYTDAMRFLADIDPALAVGRTPERRLFVRAR